MSSVNFSRVSKMDGIRSWSLEAGNSCPGSFNEKGEVVPACKGCYAKTGYYRMSNVKNPRIQNMENWKLDNWEQEMIKELDNDRYFRWLDSGDIHHPKLAEKILRICQQTPWVKHWIPTRSYKIPKIYEVLELIRALPNVSVRYSSDSVFGEYSEIHGSTIIPTLHTDDLNLTVCQSRTNDDKCKGCRKCWDKEIKIIAYPAHGRSMMKIIRTTNEEEG